MWNKPKDGQSKLVIQSAQHFMTMMWVLNELPEFFLMLLKEERKMVGGPKNPLKSSLFQIQEKKKGYECNKCEFSSTRAAVLKNHRQTKFFLVRMNARNMFKPMHTNTALAISQLVQWGK